MPIKRRFTAPPEPPKPKEEPPPSGKPFKHIRDKAPVGKKLSKIKRRFSPYLRFEGDTLVLRTPSACTSWPNEFRIHLVRDYVAPNMLINAVDARRANTKKALIVQGQRVMFVQEIRPLENMEARVVVVRNIVVNLGTKQAMELLDPDPAMRVLMVYSFLTGEDIPGLPAYNVFDWKP